MKALFVVVFTTLFSFCTFSQNGFSLVDESKGLVNKNVYSIAIDGDEVWIGTERGISKWIPETNNFVSRSTSVRINSIEIHPDFAWIGTAGKGVYQLDKKTLALKGWKQAQLRSTYVLGVYTIGGKTTVVTKSDGIFIDHGAEVLQNIDAGYVVESDKAEDGIYLHIKGKGIQKFAGEKLSKVSEEYPKICVQNGKYTGVDVKKIMLNNLEYQQSDFNNELIQNVLNFEKHSIVKTDKSIYKVNYEDKLPVKHTFNFDKQQTPAYSVNSITIFGSEKGIVVYKESEDQLVSPLPSISITTATLGETDLLTEDEKSFAFDNYILKLDASTSNMGPISKINWFLKTDDEWQKIELPFIKSDLEHGDFSFTLKATNDKGKEIQVDQPIQFSIDNPLKSEIWNYLLYLILAVIYTLIVVKVAVRKKKKDLKIVEEALLEKTSKLNKIERAKYGLVEEKKI